MAGCSMPSPKRAGKKDKQVASTSSTSANTFVSQFVSIESSLSNSSNLNPLSDLIHLIEKEAARDGDKTDLSSLLKAIKFLLRSLQALLNEHRIPLTQVNSLGQVQGNILTHTEADKAVAAWLRDRWNDAIKLLCGLVLHDKSDLRLLALSSLMALQRDASSQLSLQTSPSAHIAVTQWSSSPWTSFVSVLVAGTGKKTKVDDDVIAAFVEEYLEQYDDVRYCFCKEVSYLLHTPPSHLEQRQDLRANMIEILWGLTAIPTSEEHLDTFLVKEIPAIAKPKMAKAKAAKKEEEAEEDEEEADDWFSDSDEESSKKRQAKSVAGLGKAAQSATEAGQEKRRRKRNPPFHEAVVSFNAQKTVFSRAWLAVLLPVRKAGPDEETSVLGGPLSLSMMHETLVRMHSQILPHLVKPNLLHDFLVDCLDAGGATSLLALNALFSLVTTHNLNYPSFYTRLYSLLRSDPPFLHVRYRSRFLRLLDVFLSSTHLPAALIASFAKRLSRVALRAPPAAIVVVIPFVWNLCKRHKRCLGLLHRDFGGDRFNIGPAGVEDPFKEEENDPLKTDAINSSLWELSAMGAVASASSEQAAIRSVTEGGEIHYLASVSSLSKILAEPFTKERYDLEDFLDLTYGTLFETESAKTLKKRPGKKVMLPALAFALPSRNGKRLPLLSETNDIPVDKRIRIEAAKVAEKEGNDEDARIATLAMQEVQARAETKVQDACTSMFNFV